MVKIARAQNSTDAYLKLMQHAKAHGAKHTPVIKETAQVNGRNGVVEPATSFASGADRF